MADDDETQADAERQGRALEVLGRLQTACASGVPVSLMAAHMSLSCAGRLREATAQGVVVEIPNPPTEITLLGSTAAVTFPVGDKEAGIVADVTEVDLEESGTLCATLALPDQIRVGDRRTAVRIPVPKGALEAAIVSGDARGEARPVDISLSGILIEVGAERTEALRTGAVVLLSLRLEQRELRIEAEVCRRDGPRFGLRFVTEDGPPRRLTQIMWKLQESRLPSR